MLRFFQNDKRCVNFKMAKSLNVKRLLKSVNSSRIPKEFVLKSLEFRKQNFFIFQKIPDTILFKNLLEVTCITFVFH